MFNMTNRQSASKHIIFKPLPITLDGYEEKYQVTSDGRIFSTYLNDFIKPFFSKGGYVRVKLNYGDRSKKFMVHRLVAMAFVENKENKNVVDHIDCDRSNNDYTNLRWVTTKENSNHAVECGNKDRTLYRLINTVTEEILEFTNRHQILKHFGKICLRSLRDLAANNKMAMSGVLKDYIVERETLPRSKYYVKLQRPSSAEEYTQVSGNGEVPTV